MQPCDVNLKSLRYPCIVQPKFDGVKIAHFNGSLIGRSFKAQRNIKLNNIFDDFIFNGFEGEMIVGDNPYAQNLCRATTSVISSFDKTDKLTWLVFDYITEETINLTYRERMNKLVEYVNKRDLFNIDIVCGTIVNNEEELLAFEETQLNLGAEGIITRDPNSFYKQGRVTTRSQEVMRLKRFVHEEGIILKIIEGESNGNEATINELGHTERSSHQENMTPNGMVGSLIVRSLVNDSIDKIGAGCMTHEERVFYFNNPHELIGKIAKYKHFPKGVKDKKRFPLFECIRITEDMENKHD